MRNLCKDPNVGDFAKGFIEWFVSDLEEIAKDKQTMFLDLLGEFRHKILCSKNFSDCRDCYSDKECEAFQCVKNLVCEYKGKDNE